MQESLAKAGINRINRRSFIGGSDARIIMGNDEAALIRLWREKRGEVEPKDLSGNLVVQLGLATEELNRRWYQANTGQVITDIQKRVRHPALRWMRATLDGRIEGSDAVFESKFMLPWSFSEEAAAEKHMPQLQHNMWVVAARTAVLSVITGGGKWVEILAHADPLYQHLIVTAERKFWRCVESGEQPQLFGVEPPKPRATTSQARSLLSMARLNIARSRVLCSAWSLLLMDQTCLGRSGGLVPVSFPLFQGSCLTSKVNSPILIIHGHAPLLVGRGHLAAL